MPISPNALAAPASRKPNATLLASLEELRALGVPFVDVDALEPWAQNPRDTEHNVARVIALMLAYGWTAPIVYQRRGPSGVLSERPGGMITAGHSRWLAAKMLGLTSVPAVGRTLSDDDARKAAISDNRSTELGSWNGSELRASFASLAESERRLLGLDTPDLSSLLADIPLPNGERPRSITRPEVDPDDDQYNAPDAVETQVGDVWICGSHVVICGDSLTGATVLRILSYLEPNRAALVLTDPPYAIYGSSTGIGGNIADDRMVVPFFETVWRVCSAILSPFRHAYLCCDWRSWSAVWQGARRTDLEIKNKIVWDKGGGLGTMYAMAYEEIAFATKTPRRSVMKGGDIHGQREVHQPNIIKAGRVTRKERHGHNAAKPVGLLEILIRNSTDEGETVVDLFAGSGSTLIAAERTGRRCIAVDMEPLWAETTAKRWEKLTGRKAERIKFADLPSLEAAEIPEAGA